MSEETTKHAPQAPGEATGDTKQRLEQEREDQRAAAKGEPPKAVVPSRQTKVWVVAPPALAERQKAVCDELYAQAYLTRPVEAATATTRLSHGFTGALEQDVVICLSPDDAVALDAMRKETGKAFTLALCTHGPLSSADRPALEAVDIAFSRTAEEGHGDTDFENQVVPVGEIRTLITPFFKKEA